MWRRIRSSNPGKETRDLQRKEAVTSEGALEQQTSVRVDANPPEICHFLRLPAELRLKIFAFTETRGNIIEVLNLPTVEIGQITQCYRTYSTNPTEHRLLYRLEPNADGEPETASASTQTKSGLGSWRKYVPKPTSTGRSQKLEKVKRCFSVHGLFVLPKVCRQVREDTHLLVYELNGFAFSAGNFNFRRALSAFQASLTAREMLAVYTLYWPFIDIVSHRRRLQDDGLESPLRQSCTEELRLFGALKKIVLRYFENDLRYLEGRWTEEEEQELKVILADRRSSRYQAPRELTRRVVMRSMVALIDRADTKVECERSWRAYF
ncbi:hypothetical protein E8E13_000842 [Curvularia kusanoi]|uniref:F-box domain-containing protein n=1 Tax=Curvularia kusanoi TaxID=90978 RepID=A0A9P4W3Y4_CURKU|nr:hypothetical protein E8E13_000842 [Curvularia kusanoi]